MPSKPDSRIATLLAQLREENQRLTLVGEYNAEAGHILGLLRDVIALAEIVEEVDTIIEPLRTLRDARIMAEGKAEAQRWAKATAEEAAAARVASLDLPKRSLRTDGT